MTKGARLYFAIWAVLATAFVVALAQTRVGADPGDPVRLRPARAPEAHATVLAQADLAPPADPFLEPRPLDPSPALLSARALVDLAAQQATADASLARDRTLLHEAAGHLRRDPETALELVARLLEVPQDPALQSRAHWIEGEAHAALGHYDDALAAWDLVLETPAADYLELRRIRALLGLGRPGEAAERADELLGNLPDPAAHSQHEARALRLRGLYEDHNWELFVDEAWTFLERYPEYPRRDQLLLWIGRAESARGQLDAAAYAFDTAVWEFPYRPTAAPAWLGLQTLRAAGADMPHHSYTDRFERALRLRINKHWTIAAGAFADLLRDVLADMGDGSFANEIRFEMARNAYGGNDYAAALGHLEEVIARDSEGVGRYAAYGLLSDTHARLGNIEAGVDALRQRGGSRARLHENLAEYYYENGGYDEALEHYEELRSNRRQDSWEHTLLEFMAGEYEAAAVGFADLADRSGGNVWARNRYFEGRAHMEMGDLDDAREAFEDVRASRGGLNYYGLQAENRLIELDRSQPPTLVAEAPAAVPARQADPSLSLDVDVPVTTPVFVEGGELRLGQADDDTPSAAGEFLRAIDLQLTALVRRQLPHASTVPVDDGGSRFLAPARMHWDGPDGVPDTHLALLASGHEIETPFLGAVDLDAPDRLADEYGHLLPDLVRAAYLHDVGQWREAWQEVRDATLEFRGYDRGGRRPRAGRPIELSFSRFAHFIDNRAEDTGLWGIELSGRRFYIPDDRDGRDEAAERQIAIYDARNDIREDLRDSLMAIGDFHMVRRFARETSGWRETQPTDEFAETWSEVFPRAYPELVTDFAERWEVNPYLIWALMHVESSFNPDSISRANARGLLQVIPKTGELIAERLGYWDFGPSNLMDPELSIEFGCYYFSELMHKFHGQELLAFSAYNAGPHQMARWLEGRGDLPLDAFIETIPFEQAREYTKKVYRFVVLYRELYLDQPGLYVGNVIDPAYENNIHF